MALDPRTPVIVGVGQHVHRASGLDDALEPAALMELAARAATLDAGLGSVPAADALRVVGLISWRYGNPARFVAERLGISPAELALTTMGGNSPQSLVNRTAGEIARGELDLAILTGAEAWRTRMRARQHGADLSWPKADPADAPRLLGEDLSMNLSAETERGITMPVQIYPMFETAIRADSGREPDDHLVRISELWARLSAVAATNPYAWRRDPLTAEQIRTPGPSNRMVGFPYAKYMNSNNDVDMGAALIVCSVETAERLGVARDRWVFPLAGTDAHEHQYVSHRWSFAETPAIELAGRRALELAGAAIDDVAVVDLYSCFPSAVQLGARSLGLSIDAQLTRTGGLSFAGGPWNNYVMHAIATVVGDLRERPGELGLVWANGGYATKHAFGVYSTAPPIHGFRHDHPQPEIDRLPRRDLATPADAAGEARIEAYTVMHDREGAPQTVLAATLLADGRRAWATSSEPALAAGMCVGEWVGRRVELDPDGQLHPD
jgi:acetyl-CoA C-acetyltransferase